MDMLGEASSACCHRYRDTAEIELNVLCSGGEAGESEHNSLAAQVAGRGTPGRESWPGRDRSERGPHWTGAAASVHHLQLPN